MLHGVLCCVLFCCGVGCFTVYVIVQDKAPCREPSPGQLPFENGRLTQHLPCPKPACAKSMVIRTRSHGFPESCLQPESTPVAALTRGISIDTPTLARPASHETPALTSRRSLLQTTISIYLYTYIYCSLSTSYVSTSVLSFRQGPGQNLDPSYHVVCTKKRGRNGN